MKKIICTILALALCLCALTSCSTASKTLTGTVAAISENGVITLNVCDEYTAEFGKTVTVRAENELPEGLALGTEIEIEIKSVSKNSPYEIVAKKISLNGYMEAYKPVIYLYPEEETNVSVKVNLDGKLTCTYPEHGEGGWQNFTAKPDGTLVSPDGREYYCLYWEGLSAMTPDFSRGFCVKGEDTADFLADILPKIGLSAREANEFIIYWLPILQKNEYNLISFQSEAYTNAAGLEITPAPDSLLRVFMAAKPLDAPVEIAPQEFEGFQRNGFTVVEWGGGIAE